MTPRDEHGDPIRTADVADGHRCAFDHDTTGTPDHRGAVTVTELCACGRTLRAYTDYVL